MLLAQPSHRAFQAAERDCVADVSSRRARRPRFGTSLQDRPTAARNHRRDRLPGRVREDHRVIGDASQVRQRREHPRELGMDRRVVTRQQKIGGWAVGDGQNGRPEALRIEGSPDPLSKVTPNGRSNSATYLVTQDKQQVLRAGALRGALRLVGGECNRTLGIRRRAEARCPPSSPQVLSHPRSSSRTC